MQLVNKLLDYSCNLVLLSSFVAGGYWSLRLAYDILYFTFGSISN